MYFPRKLEAANFVVTQVSENCAKGVARNCFGKTDPNVVNMIPSMFGLGVTNSGLEDLSCLILPIITMKAHC